MNMCGKGIRYFTTVTVSGALWPRNSGAYMHSTVAMPFKNVPSWVANSG